MGTGALSMHLSSTKSTFRPKSYPNPTRTVSPLTCAIRGPPEPFHTEHGLMDGALQSHQRRMAMGVQVL